MNGKKPENINCTNFRCKPGKILSCKLLLNTANRETLPTQMVASTLCYCEGQVKIYANRNSADKIKIYVMDEKSVYKRKIGMNHLQRFKEPHTKKQDITCIQEVTAFHRLTILFML